MKTAAMPKLVLVAAIVAALALVAYLVVQNSQASAAASPLSNVTVSDLYHASQAGARVIDVREPFEYAEGHVAGSELVPLGTIHARVNDFPKDEPIYVFCRSGNRSLQAAQTLVDAGYTDVRNVEGGIIAWNNARLPVAR